MHFKDPLEHMRVRLEKELRASALGLFRVRMSLKFLSWILNPGIFTDYNSPWGNLRNEAPPGGSLYQGAWPIPELSTHLLRCPKQFISSFFKLLCDHWNYLHRNPDDQCLTHQRILLEMYYNCIPSPETNSTTCRIKISALFHELLIRNFFKKQENASPSPTPYRTFPALFRSTLSGCLWREHLLQREGRFPREVNPFLQVPSVFAAAFR